VVRGSLVARGGEIHWPLPKIQPTAPAASTSGGGESTIDFREASSASGWRRWALQIAGVVVLVALLLFIGRYAPASLVAHLTVFVLACFVGWQVIWSVTPALHTPLMSVTNAISGIILIGAMFQFQSPWYAAATLLAAVAVLVASINVAGGFLVTHRMLGMFRKG
jgi:NAD(P) transhydrogenase subunit alpha